MSPGSSTDSYPAFAHIGLRENPAKTSIRFQWVYTLYGHISEFLPSLTASSHLGHGLPPELVISPPAIPPIPTSRKHAVNLTERPLHGTETRTLRRNEEKRIEAFEMWISRRMECVKWADRIRNEAVLERVGEERMMLKLIRRGKGIGWERSQEKEKLTGQPPFNEQKLLQSTASIQKVDVNRIEKKTSPDIC
ncbi:hypothetical protein ANN_07027 [Periplaneta americana]|uniref:Uncharacterized protein n=1 Tax=Periplaneta americana TaxID=6978 RepID=A0ABQ8TF45_PERAM|nr:hypothetical protein ANN_07027 [Periplaneta americana]